MYQMFDIRVKMRNIPCQSAGGVILSSASSVMMPAIAGPGLPRGVVQTLAGPGLPHRIGQTLASSRNWVSAIGPGDLD